MTTYIQVFPKQNYLFFLGANASIDIGQFSVLTHFVPHEKVSTFCFEKRNCKRCLIGSLDPSQDGNLHSSGFRASISGSSLVASMCMYVEQYVFGQSTRQVMPKLGNNKNLLKSLDSMFCIVDPLET